MHGFILVVITSSCVSKVIFDNAEASARLLAGLKIMVNEPLPAEVVPESGVIAEI